MIHMPYLRCFFDWHVAPERGSLFFSLDRILFHCSIPVIVANPNPLSAFPAEMGFAMKKGKVTSHGRGAPARDKVHARHSVLRALLSRFFHKPKRGTKKNRVHRYSEHYTLDWNWDLDGLTEEQKRGIQPGMRSYFWTPIPLGMMSTSMGAEVLSVLMRDKDCKWVRENCRVLNATAGAGGSTIVLGHAFHHVAAGDYCPDQLPCLRHNVHEVMKMSPDRVRVDAQPVNVLDRTDLNEYDLVVLEPCWGGIKYKQVGPGNLQLFMQRGAYDPNAYEQTCAVATENDRMKRDGKEEIEGLPLADEMDLSRFVPLPSAVAGIMHNHARVKAVCVLVPWNFDIGRFKQILKGQHDMVCIVLDPHAVHPADIDSSMFGDLRRDLGVREMDRLREMYEYHKYTGPDRYVYVVRKKEWFASLYQTLYRPMERYARAFQRDGVWDWQGAHDMAEKIFTERTLLLFKSKLHWTLKKFLRTMMRFHQVGLSLLRTPPPIASGLAIGARPFSPAPTMVYTGRKGGGRGAQLNQKNAIKAAAKNNRDQKAAAKTEAARPASDSRKQASQGSGNAQNRGGGNAQRNPSKSGKKPAAASGSAAAASSSAAAAGAKPAKSFKGRNLRFSQWENEMRNVHGHGEWMDQGRAQKPEGWSTWDRDDKDEWFDQANAMAAQDEDDYARERAEYDEYDETYDEDDYDEEYARNQEIAERAQREVNQLQEKKDKGRSLSAQEQRDLDNAIRARDDALARNSMRGGGGRGGGDDDDGDGMDGEGGGVGGGGGWYGTGGGGSDYTGSSGAGRNKPKKAPVVAPVAQLDAVEGEDNSVAVPWMPIFAPDKFAVFSRDAVTHKGVPYELVIRAGVVYNNVPWDEYVEDDAMGKSSIVRYNVIQCQDIHGERHKLYWNGYMSRDMAGALYYAATKGPADGGNWMNVVEVVYNRMGNRVCYAMRWPRDRYFVFTDPAKLKDGRHPRFAIAHEASRRPPGSSDTNVRIVERNRQDKVVYMFSDQVGVPYVFDVGTVITRSPVQLVYRGFHRVVQVNGTTYTYIIAVINETERKFFEYVFAWRDGKPFNVAKRGFYDMFFVQTDADTASVPAETFKLADLARKNIFDERPQGGGDAGSKGVQNAADAPSREIPFLVDRSDAYLDWKDELKIVARDSWNVVKGIQYGVINEAYDTLPVTLFEVARPVWDSDGKACFLAYAFAKESREGTFAMPALASEDRGVGGASSEVVCEFIYDTYGRVVAERRASEDVFHAVKYQSIDLRPVPLDEGSQRFLDIRKGMEYTRYDPANAWAVMKDAWAYSNIRPDRLVFNLAWSRESYHASEERGLLMAMETSGRIVYVVLYSTSGNGRWVELAVDNKGYVVAVRLDVEQTFRILNYAYPLEEKRDVPAPRRPDPVDAIPVEPDEAASVEEEPARYSNVHIIKELVFEAAPFKTMYTVERSKDVVRYKSIDYYPFPNRFDYQGLQLRKFAKTRSKYTFFRLGMYKNRGKLLLDAGSNADYFAEGYFAEDAKHRIYILAQRLRDDQDNANRHGNRDRMEFVYTKDGVLVAQREFKESSYRSLLSMSPTSSIVPRPKKQLEDARHPDIRWKGITYSAWNDEDARFQDMPMQIVTMMHSMCLHPWGYGRDSYLFWNAPYVAVSLENPGRAYFMMKLVGQKGKFAEIVVDYRHGDIVGMRMINDHAFGIINYVPSVLEEREDGDGYGLLHYVMQDWTMHVEPDTPDEYDDGTGSNPDWEMYNGTSTPAKSRRR